MLNELQNDMPNVFENTLKGFPTVRYISLKESVNRRNFMKQQLDMYGIPHRPFIVDRYSEIKDSVDVNIIPESARFALSPLQIGCAISQIENMRDWLDNTDEEYVIFCDDDMNFDSIFYWTFTWKEFVENLPPNWNIIQLIRMDDSEELYSVNLKLQHGRFWGTARLMNRGSVEWLLGILQNPDGSYNLVANGGEFMPIVENVLFLNLPRVYNFPLLTEFNNENLNSTGLVYIDDSEKENHLKSKARCKYYNYVIDKRWELMGKYVNIREALAIP